MNSDSKINADVAHRLKNYVYALVDPRDGIPFYIGKGTSGRVEQHGLDARAWVEAEDLANASSKIKQINDIKRSGHEVDVWILRYGMNKREYSAVESTLIDFIQTFPIAPSSERIRPLKSGSTLTNLVRGGETDQGITRLSDIVDELRAPALTIDRPLLLIMLGPWTDQEEVMPDGKIRSGHGFKNEWMDKKLLEDSIHELGDSVCCWWTWDTSRIEKTGINHVVAVYRGVTRGLFEIVPGSHCASATRGAKRRGCSVTPITSSEDQLWKEVIGPHGHTIPAKKKGERSAFRYWPY